ncbi:hypothetical protein CUZ56_02941 [Saezia sanguinis]|uniref:Uncharacterized protein n=1 Tax=Saezia sanguinis TaxID=1965230 RepID=A0A433S9Z1_9BURK|nr:hypothetical protein [Saezia sanguinis]RUS65484.1 hypothetical protein CUZ56_02941 [Saezia sanguinis]
MKTRHKTLVPRNPYAAAAAQKKAGTHEKSTKAKRQQAKRQLRALLDTPDKGGNNPPLFFWAFA